MQDVARSLTIETTAAVHLLTALQEVIAGDEQLAADTIEGETNLFEAVDRVLIRMGEIDTMMIGLSAHLATLSERRARFDRQYERLREAVRDAMTMVKLKKIERPLATLSLRPAPPSVQIDNREDLPDAYRRYPEWQPDKTAIKTAILAGHSVAGARLSDPRTTLHVREV